MNRNGIALREWAHAVLSSVHEAVIVIDDKLRIAFANDAAAKMLNASRPLLIGHYVWKALPIFRNDQQITEQQYSDAFASHDFSLLSGPMVLMFSESLLLVNATPKFLPQFGHLVLVFEDDKRIQLALERQERKTAEVAQEKARNILESITDAFFALDSQWRFTYINSQADPFFPGKTRGKLIGKLIWEEFPELESTNLYTQCLEAVNTSSTLTFQEFHIHVNAWLEFRLYPAKEGLSVYFRDVTANKIAEQRVVAQYEITRILSESLSIESAVPAILEAIGKNLRWDWVGFWVPNSRDTLLSLSKYWHSDSVDKSYLDINLQTHWSKGKGFIGMAWEKKESVWAKNFKKASLHTALAIPLVNNNVVLGVLELAKVEKIKESQQLVSYKNALANQIGQFIQRKKAEMEAKASEERFRLLVAGAKDYVMMMMDEGGNIVSWNEGGERLLGYSEDEVIGKHFSIFFPEEEQKTNKPQMEIDRAISDGNSIDEGYMIGKDGSTFWASGTTTTLRDDNGNVRGLVKIAKDASLRKQQEERKDEFISMASHELKTPVTSVKVFTQILKKRLENYPDPEILRFLTKMDGQLDKLTKLISDLLNLSKIQAGKLEFHWEEVNIDALVTDIVENMQATSQRNPIILMGSVGVRIQGDQDRIGQVLINLLTNAMKYSPAASSIEVTLGKNENFVTISVRDFGIGIEKKHQEKIFDRFYQAHEESKAFPGLGIGLYISREIARRHGGDIQIESKKKEGSIFTLLLPISYEILH